jgi:hypothetical protein
MGKPISKAKQSAHATIYTAAKPSQKRFFYKA